MTVISILMQSFVAAKQNPFFFFLFSSFSVKTCEHNADLFAL